MLFSSSSLIGTLPPFGSATGLALELELEEEDAQVTIGELRRSPNGRHSRRTYTSAAVVTEVRMATLKRFFIVFPLQRISLAEPEKTEGDHHRHDGGQNADPSEPL